MSSPGIPIVEIWNECLGSTAISFDTERRQAQIEHDCKHLALRRHIEAWTEDDAELVRMLDSKDQPKRST